MKKVLLSTLMILIGCALYGTMCHLLNVKPNIELCLLLIIAIDVKVSTFNDKN